MKTLLICYDVVDPETNAAVATVIRSMANRWARLLASTWLVETICDAASIEAHVAPLLGLDDALIVQTAAGSPALINTVARWSEPSCVVPGDGAEVIPWRRGKVAEAA